MKKSKFKQDLIDLNHKVTEKDFNYHLSVVPPKAIKGDSFLVGEAWGVGLAGKLIYDCYIGEKNQYYYAGRMSIRDFNKHF